MGVEEEGPIGDVVGIVEDLEAVEEDILLIKRSMFHKSADGKAGFLAIRIGLSER